MGLATTLEERWMTLALKEAEAALDEGEEPVGAVILDASIGAVLGRAHHQTLALNDPTAHALMIALTQLSAVPEEDALDPETLRPRVVSHRDRELIVVTTQEPCLMCSGALLLHAGIQRLVYGAADERLGACGSHGNLLAKYGAGRSLLVQGGILEGLCRDLLKRHRAAKPAREN